MESKKKISILGDSISTFDGFNPQGNNVFYFESESNFSGVKNVADTWWNNVIESLNGELLVNESWSGSRVTMMPELTNDISAGCSVTRSNNLHKGAVEPDIIIIFMGTNDWINDVEIKENSSSEKTNKLQFFENAYTNMIKDIKNLYKNTEIWCMTLCKAYVKEKSEFVFPLKSEGRDWEEYNNIIRNTGELEKCRIIDLYKNYKMYESFDGVHPTAKGMKEIAEMIKKDVII